MVKNPGKNQLKSFTLSLADFLYIPSPLLGEKVRMRGMTRVLSLTPPRRASQPSPCGRGEKVPNSRFNISLRDEQVHFITQWLLSYSKTKNLLLGYFSPARVRRRCLLWPRKIQEIRIWPCKNIKDNQLFLAQIFSHMPLCLLGKRTAKKQ